VVYAVDCNVSALLPLAGPGCEVRQIDLETFARGNGSTARTTPISCSAPANLLEAFAMLTVVAFAQGEV
jgi:hypothetical protein